jgi:hypothetical protein
VSVQIGYVCHTLSTGDSVAIFGNYDALRKGSAFNDAHRTYGLDAPHRHRRVLFGKAAWTFGGLPTSACVCAATPAEVTPSLDCSLRAFPGLALLILPSLTLGRLSDWLIGRCLMQRDSPALKAAGRPWPIA